MLLIHGLLAGIIATVLFDIYQIALNYAYGINKTKWDLVGRYFIGLKNNKYFREDLTNDSPEKYELIYGYLIHYTIGIIYGFFYILTTHFQKYCSAHSEKPSKIVIVTKNQRMPCFDNFSNQKCC